MYVSPKKASFKKSMRGYRARQVDSYIESLCSDFAGAEEDYQSRIVSLEKEIASLKEQLAQSHAVELENAALREEVERLHAHRVRLIRRVKAADERKKEKAPRLTPEQRQERMHKVFATGAQVVRLVGHTGQKVSRIVRALPERKPAAPATPVAKLPTTAKEAKKLTKTLAKKERVCAQAQKKIKKARKTEQKQIKKLQKLEQA